MRAIIHVFIDINIILISSRLLVVVVVAVLFE